MRATFRLILRLYPADHRANFALEMMRTFEQGAAEYRKGQCDRSGLVRGLVDEWISKLIGGNCYLAVSGESPWNPNLRLVLKRCRPAAGVDL
jgi:hypothetical protein